LALALAVAALGASCSGAPRGDFGYLPQASDLVCTPASLAVGATTTVSGQVTFFAPNADLFFLFAQVTDPSGQALPLVRFDVSYAYGYTQGVLPFSLPITASSSGSYQLKVWLKDFNGQNSSAVTATLPAS
jgi:hypothetical protein